MAARRCSTCSISYPETGTQFYKCQVCDEATDWISNNEPDVDWEWKVEYRIARAEAAERAVELVPRAEEPLPIYEECSRFFVNQSDLIRAGIRRNSAHSLWLFASNGHVWEAQGWNESKRRWWIEQVARDTDQPTEAVPTGG